MSTVQEYLTKLLEGEAVHIPSYGENVERLVLDPPFPANPDRGIGPEINAQRSLELARAMEAWQRAYRHQHPEDYRKLTAGNPA